MPRNGSAAVSRYQQRQFLGGARHMHRGAVFDPRTKRWEASVYMLGDRPSDGKLVPILTPIKSVGTTVSTKGQVRRPCCSSEKVALTWCTYELGSRFQSDWRDSEQVNSSSWMTCVTLVGSSGSAPHDCPYGALTFRNTCSTENNVLTNSRPQAHVFSRLCCL